MRLSNEMNIPHENINNVWCIFVKQERFCFSHAPLIVVLLYFE